MRVVYEESDCNSNVRSKTQTKRARTANPNHGLRWLQGGVHREGELLELNLAVGARRTVRNVPAATLHVAHVW